MACDLVVYGLVGSLMTLGAVMFGNTARHELFHSGVETSTFSPRPPTVPINMCGVYAPLVAEVCSPTASPTSLPLAPETRESMTLTCLTFIMSWLSLARSHMDKMLGHELIAFILPVPLGIVLGFLLAHLPEFLNANANDTEQRHCVRVASQLHDIQDEVRATEIELRAARTNLQNVEDSENKANSRLEELRIEVDEQQQEAERLDERIESTRQKHQEWTLKLDRLESASQAILNRTRDATAVERRIQNMDGTIKDKTSLVQKLQSQVMTHEQTLRDRNATIESMNVQVHKLQHKADGYYAEIDQSKAEIRSQATRIQMLQDQLQVEETQVKETEQIIKSRDDSLQLLENELKTRVGELMEKDLAMGHMNDRLSELESQAKAREDKLADKDETIQAREDSLEEIETTLMNLSEEMNAAIKKERNFFLEKTAGYFALSEEQKKHFMKTGILKQEGSTLPSSSRNRSQEAQTTYSVHKESAIVRASTTGSTEQAQQHQEVEAQQPRSEDSLDTDHQTEYTAGTKATQQGQETTVSQTHVQHSESSSNELLDRVNVTKTFDPSSLARSLKRDQASLFPGAAQFNDVGHTAITFGARTAAPRAPNFGSGQNAAIFTFNSSAQDEIPVDGLRLENDNNNTSEDAESDEAGREKDPRQAKRVKDKAMQMTRTRRPAKQSSRGRGGAGAGPALSESFSVNLFPSESAAPTISFGSSAVGLSKDRGDDNAKEASPTSQASPTTNSENKLPSQSSRKLFEQETLPGVQETFDSSLRASTSSAQAHGTNDSEAPILQEKADGSSHHVPSFEGPQFTIDDNGQIVEAPAASDDSPATQARAEMSKSQKKRATARENWKATAESDPRAVMRETFRPQDTEKDKKYNKKLRYMKNAAQEYMDDQGMEWPLDGEFPA